MATELGVAYLSLSIESAGVAKDTKKALGEIEGVADSVGRKSGQSLGSKLATGIKVGTAAVTGLAATIAGIALKGGISRALSIEDAQAKLTGLGHSTQTVQTIMDNALASVKGTAFGLGDAAGLAATLVASGIKPGEQLEATLKRVADSATIAGTDLSDMGLIWGKAAAKGRLDGEIINQLLERQIPIYDILGAQMGKNAAEVSKMVSAGKVDFATFSDAMNAYLGGAALKSGETFRGALANVTAALGRLGAAVATPALESLKGIFNAAIPAIDSATSALSPLIESLANKLAPVIQTLADKLSALITNIDFGKVIDQVKSFSGALLPLGGLIAGLSGSGLTTAFPALAKVLPTITGPMGLLAGAITAVVAASPELRDALGGALGAIGDALSGVAPLFPIVATAVSALAGALGSALASAINAILPILNTAASLLGSVAGWVADNTDLVGALAVAVGTAVLAVKTWTLATRTWAAVTGAAKAIQAAYTAATYGQVGATYAAGTAQKILNLAMRANPIGIVITAITALVGALVWFFTKTETGKKLWEGFVNWLGTAWNWLKDRAEAVWGAISGFFTGAWDRISGIWNSVGAYFSGVWDQIQAAIEPVVTWWDSNVAPVFESGGELIGLVFDRIKVGAQVLWTGLQTVFGWISDGWALVWDGAQIIYNAVIKPVFDKIATGAQVLWAGLQTIFGWISDGFSIAWNAIKNAWETIGAVVFNAIHTYLSALQTVWSTIWEAIKRVAEGVWNGIKIAIETALGVIRGVIDTVTALIKGDWSGAWDAIKGVVDTIWGGIQRGVENAVNTVRDVVGGIKDKVLDALKGAGDWLLDTGKMLIEGLWNGIGDKVEWLKEKLSGIATTVIDSVKGFFGIHSPSRVFMEIGDFNMQGLSLGMEDGYADVKKTVRQIGTDLPNRLAPNTADLRLNPDGKALVQQTINPQPGMSEEQIGTSAGRALAVAMQGVNL